MCVFGVPAPALPSLRQRRLGIAELTDSDGVGYYTQTTILTTRNGCAKLYSLLQGLSPVALDNPAQTFVRVARLLNGMRAVTSQICCISFGDGFEVSAVRHWCFDVLNKLLRINVCE